MPYNYNSPIIIGIAGGSGSGKTRLSEQILNILGRDNVNIISHDNYYKDISDLNIDERNKTNFDHPSSLDTELLINHLNKLKIRNSVKMPIYDFTTHTRKKNVFIDIKPKSIIILEGILIFTNKELIDLLDIKIYMEVESDIRFIRRLKRDINDRGRNQSQVIKQYLESVKPMYTKYVEPSKKYADIIVPSDKSNDVVLNLIVNALEK